MGKSNQLFKDFVKEQKTLNEFEVKDIEIGSEEILQDTKQFAKEFIESNLALNFGKIFKAHRLGMDFAKKNIQNQ